jgi:hypothetical protein
MTGNPSEGMRRLPGTLAGTVPPGRCRNRASSDPKNRYALGHVARGACQVPSVLRLWITA